MNMFRKAFISCTVLVLTLVSFSCAFVESLQDSSDSGTGGLSFDSSSLSLSCGEMGLVNLHAAKNQSSAAISWTYDETLASVKSDNYGAVVTALAPGQVTLRASNGADSAVCIITISGSAYRPVVENPYVYASEDVVTVAPGASHRIYASVFGGDSGTSGYTWTVDKPSVASLSTEGNYCWISGVSAGSARITVSNSSVGSYSYSVLVNVASDSSVVPYITTQSNIVSVNITQKPEADFTVSLKNGSSAYNRGAYAYSVVDGNGDVISAPCFTVTSSGESFHVSAAAPGEGIIRITHPDALYPLDVHIRACEESSKAYIDLSSTVVTLTSVSQSDSVTASVKGLLPGIEDNPDLYKWTVSADAEKYVKWSFSGGTESGTGNEIVFMPVATGIAKFTVSYPSAASGTRSVIVIVRNLSAEASDAATYITTSQNYIRTYVGADDTHITVMLNNTAAGEENNLVWNIVSSADDMSKDPVIEYVSGTGISKASSARSVLSYNASGSAVIKPLKAGTAEITLSHPAAVYDTKILVKVLAAKPENKEDPWVLSTDTHLVDIISGGSETVTMSMTGASKTESDEKDIVWTSSDPAVSVAGNGISGVVSYTGSSSGTGYITVSHPKAGNTVKIPFRYASTKESLAALKTLYASGDTCFTIYTGETCRLYIQTEGLSDTDTVTWKVGSGNNSVITYAQTAPLIGEVSGAAPGAAVVTASCPGAGEVTFYITVKQKGIQNEGTDCYLTTRDNVVLFSKISETQNVSVQFQNVDSSQYSGIIWSVSDPSAYDISSNGVSASVTSLKSESEAVLTVTHPLSGNSLAIHLRTGNRYLYKNEDYSYIESDMPVVRMTEGDAPLTIHAVVSHSERTEKGLEGFTFDSSDPLTASVSFSGNTCIVEAQKAGSSVIKVKNSSVSESGWIDIPVIITEKGSLSAVPYITSVSSAVATVGAGQTAALSASLVNAISVPGDWFWSSDDTGIADISVKTGSTVLVSGIKPGTVHITAGNRNSRYSFSFIVIVIDESAAAAAPYIKTSSSIVSVDSGSSVRVSADIAGGKSDSDSLYFQWNIRDSSVAMLSSSGGTADIRGLTAGLTYVTVRNTQYPSAYERTILVYVSDSSVAGCYIQLDKRVVKLVPGSSSVTVNAELGNGEVLDAENFSWWIDDPKVASIQSAAGKCVITPSSVSGTTYIHVKHPKVLKTADIIVLSSEYDAYGFPETNKTVRAGQVYFISMQLPEGEGAQSVKYTSTNPDVCLAAGNAYTCMIQGKSGGTAVIEASLIINGKVSATADLAVSVTESVKNAPCITFSKPIAVLPLGTSEMYTASISGTGITDAARYELKWHIQNNPAGLTLSGSTEKNSITGDSAYFTAVLPGNYAVTCEYTDGTSADMLIQVPDKKEILISLDKTSLSMSRDDGGEKLTAVLTNAEESDYDTITWSAAKVNGINIVSISKTGKVCSILPRSPGVTTITASLPSGVLAQCFVSVSASGSIIFSNTTLRLTPGETRTVSYTIEPAGADVSFFDLQNVTSSEIGGAMPKYYSYETNTAAHTITVTGIGEAAGKAGTISAALSGGKSASVNIYVEYSPELSLGGPSYFRMTNPDSNETIEADNSSYIKLNTPGGKAEYSLRTFTYTAYPSTMTLSTSLTINGRETELFKVSEMTSKYVEYGGRLLRTGTITIDPHGEGTVLFTLTGTTGSKEGTVTKTATKNFSAFYDHYTITAENTELKQGGFSKYEPNTNGGSGTLILGDGEAVILGFRIAEENALPETLNATYEAASAPSENNDDNRLSETCSRYSTGNNSGNYSQTGHITMEKETTETDKTAAFRIGHNYDYKLSGDENKVYCITKDMFYILYNVTWTGQESSSMSNNYYKATAYDCFNAAAGNGFIYHYNCWEHDHDYTVSHGVFRDSFGNIINFDEGQRASAYRGTINAGLYFTVASLTASEGTDLNSILTLKGMFCCPNILTVEYKDCKPYCITQTQYRSNPNYYRGRFEHKWDAGCGHDDSVWCGPDSFHAYATLVDSVDTTEITAAERRGIITVSVPSVSGGNTASQKTLCTINVVIQKRNCASYNAGWHRETVYGSDRWVQD